MTDAAYIIEADNLCKKYNGQRVVDMISLRMVLGLTESVCRK